MKTLSVVITLLLLNHSITAQENNLPLTKSEWTFGLNYSIYDFNADTQYPYMLLSLEKKLSNGFFLSLNIGIGSFQPNNTNPQLSSFNLHSGLTMTQMSSTTFEPAIRIPTFISLRYSPFDWKFSPYISIGVGMEYFSGYNSSTTNRNIMKSADGNTISDNESVSELKGNGVFSGLTRISLGATYNFYKNLFFDSNISYQGDFSFFMGLKYGF